MNRRDRPEEPIQDWVRLFDYSGGPLPSEFMVVKTAQVEELLSTTELVDELPSDGLVLTLFPLRTDAYLGFPMCVGGDPECSPIATGTQQWRVWECACWQGRVDTGEGKPIPEIRKFLPKKACGLVGRLRPWSLSCVGLNCDTCLLQAKVEEVGESIAGLPRPKLVTFFCTCT